MRNLAVAALIALASVVFHVGAASADDTHCVGALGPVVVDNVIVPSGAECVLDGTQRSAATSRSPASRTGAS
jgi:hypothetical protein